jgi:hypothetical protein
VLHIRFRKDYPVAPAVGGGLFPAAAGGDLLPIFETVGACFEFSRPDHRAGGRLSAQSAARQRSSKGNINFYSGIILT